MDFYSALRFLEAGLYIHTISLSDTWLLSEIWESATDSIISETNFENI